MNTSIPAAQMWDERYGDAHIWSGRPNTALVDEVSDLTPGRALDLGSGEGGDAIWLAEQGWQVTAVDISRVAADRAALASRERGVQGRIIWVVADLESWLAQRPNGGDSVRPDSGETFDLVTASFLHSPAPFAREKVLSLAADRVAPGGRMVVIAHAAAPSWSAHHDMDFPTPEGDAAAISAGGGWEVEVAQVRTRPATGPDGQSALLEDSVVRARRI